MTAIAEKLAKSDRAIKVDLADVDEIARKLKQAQERQIVAMGVLLKPGALICNTLEQVMERIDSFKTKVPLPKRCGHTTRQLYARVIPETRFTSNGLIFILVRYEFAILKGNGAEVYVQYGHWGTPQPVKKEIST